MTTAPIPAQRVTLVKIALLIATLFVAFVIKYCYDIAGFKFAASFGLAALSILLIPVGLLFKFKGATETISIIGLIAGIAGFMWFNPTDNIPHDPNIRHEFTASGGTIKPASDNPCTWINADKGQIYICDLIVEPGNVTIPVTQPES